MILTLPIENAIRFSIKTHEVYQKQKRKGKDIPYITHPLTVGLLLARANASEEVIVAGILHDTIEDSIASKKVTPEMLVERFGESVADLVLSLTEKRKDLPWAQRKCEAIARIKTLSHDALVVKSADLIANVSEILCDFKTDGIAIFGRFNGPADKVVSHYREAMETILGVWSENPFTDDLKALIAGLNEIKT